MTAEVDYMNAGGGGADPIYVEQTTSVSGSGQTVTISGLTNIFSVAARYPSETIAYGYYGNDSQYHYVTEKPTYISITNISGNVITLSIYSTASITFYVYGT